MDINQIQNVDLKAASAVAASATETSAALLKRTGAIMGAVETAVNERAKTREAELQQLPADARTAARNIEQKLANSTRRDLTAQAIEKNQDDVKKMLAQLQDQRAKLQTLAELAGPGPEYLLTVRGTTGSDRSGVLFQQVQAAGHATLAVLAKQAVASGDVELGAQIALRLASMDVKDRPLAVQDLGKALVGDEHARLTAAIQKALDETADGIAAAGRFLMGRDETPHEKIERGLRARGPAVADRDAIGTAMKGGK